MLRLNWFVRLRQTERIFPNIGLREPRLLSLNPADSWCVCFPNSVKKQSYKTLMVFLCLRHKHQSVEQMFFLFCFFLPTGKHWCSSGNTWLHWWGVTSKWRSNYKVRLYILSGAQNICFCTFAFLPLWKISQIKRPAATAQRNFLSADCCSSFDDLMQLFSCF